MSTQTAPETRRNRQKQAASRKRRPLRLETLERRELMSAVPPFETIDREIIDGHAAAQGAAIEAGPQQAVGVQAGQLPRGDAPGTRPGSRLRLNAGGDGRFAGSIGRPADRDMYRIVAPTSGRMRIDLTATSGRLNPCVSVYNANGRRIAYNDNGGPGTDARTTINVIGGRTYYVQAKSYRARTSGSYELKFDTRPDAPSNRPGNNLRLNAGGDGVFRGQIGWNNDRDMYRIVAPKSGKMQIDLTATSGGLDPCLYVYNANGRQIASNDDTGGGRNSRVRINVVAGRTYFVQARSYSGSSSGAYLLKFDTTAATTDAPSSRPGALLQLNANGDGVFNGSIGTPSDRDMYRFVAPKNGQMQIDLTATSGGLDPYLYVYNGSGQQIASNDDTGGGRNSQVTIDVTAGRTYFVLAKSYSDSSSGAYQLTFDTTTAMGPSDVFMLHEAFPGTWSDAEKSPLNNDDDLLCWAAAASNMLEWTGWGNVAGMTNTDQFFHYFQYYWTDQVGWEKGGLDWWFDGGNDMQGRPGTAQVEVQGGGGFYPSLNFNNFFREETNPARVMSAANTYLRSGDAVSFGIHGPGGHAITCWGIEYGANSNVGSVWVTDSDNDKNNPNPPNQLVRYAVRQQGGRWYLQNYGGSNDWYISAVSALARMPSQTAGLPMKAVAAMTAGLPDFTSGIPSVTAGIDIERQLAFTASNSGQSLDALQDDQFVSQVITAVSPQVAPQAAALDELLAQRAVEDEFDRPLADDDGAWDALLDELARPETDNSPLASVFADTEELLLA